MSRVPVYVKRGAFLSGSDLDTGQVVQIFFLSLTHRLFHSLDSSFCTLCSSSSSPLFFFPPVSLPFASAAGSTWVYPLVLLDSSSLQVQLLIKETQVFQSRVRREHIKKEQRERERERGRERERKKGLPSTSTWIFSDAASPFSFLATKLYVPRFSLDGVLISSVTWYCPLDTSVILTE